MVAATDNHQRAFLSGKVPGARRPASGAAGTDFGASNRGHRQMVKHGERFVLCGPCSVSNCSPPWVENGRSPQAAFDPECVKTASNLEGP